MSASHHIALAARIASRSTHRQHHHAAILLRGGAIVACGYNHGTRHAEIVALNKLWPSKRRGLVLWSFRFTRAGLLAIAAPCRRCQRALADAGVSRAYYSTAGGAFECLEIGR